MFADQLREGEDYYLLKKCVSISILDFRLFQGETDFYSCFHIREDTRGFLFSDKMEFHVIELPKLPEELKDDSSDLLVWAKFINAEREEEFDMLAKRSSYVASAYKRLKTISQDSQKRLEYEAREKALRDYNHLIMESEERGVKRGREETAKKMLLAGFDASLVSDMTGLSDSEIDLLRQKD